MTLPDHDPKRSYKKPVEEVAKLVREDDVCGLTVNGERVFCDSIRLEGLNDGYGEPLRHRVCECRASATRYINRLRELGFISDLGIAAIRAEEGEGK